MKLAALVYSGKYEEKRRDEKRRDEGGGEGEETREREGDTDGEVKVGWK